MRNKLIMIVVALVLILGVGYWVTEKIDARFEEIGTISTQQQQGQSKMFLHYRDVSKELIIDEESLCGDEQDTIPCIAMSATFDIPFGGKAVRVEGTEKRDGTVLIKKLIKLN